MRELGACWLRHEKNQPLAPGSEVQKTPSEFSLACMTHKDSVPALAGIRAQAKLLGPEIVDAASRAKQKYESSEFVAA